MLKIRDLHVSYGGIKALKGISMEVPEDVYKRQPQGRGRHPVLHPQHVRRALEEAELVGQLGGGHDPAEAHARAEDLREAAEVDDAALGVEALDGRQRCV